LNSKYLNSAKKKFVIFEKRKININATSLLYMVVVAHKKIKELSEIIGITTANIPVLNLESKSNSIFNFKVYPSITYLSAC